MANRGNGMIVAALGLLALAIACATDPTSPYTVGAQPHANTRGGSGTPMGVIPDVDTLWVDQTYGNLFLPFIVRDSSTGTVLDTVPGQTSATGVLGEPVNAGNNMTDWWYNDNTYIVSGEGNSVYVVLAPGGSGVAFGSYYGTSVTPYDTLGAAWLSAGSGTGHYVVIFSAACTDGNIHTSRC